LSCIAYEASITLAAIAAGLAMAFLVQPPQQSWTSVSFSTSFTGSPIEPSFLPATAHTSSG